MTSVFSEFTAPSIRNIEGRLTEDQARTALREQERSGLSVGEYGRRYGLSSAQLYRWRQRFDKIASREAAVKFVPVRLAPAPAIASMPAPAASAPAPSVPAAPAPTTLGPAQLAKPDGVIEVICVSGQTVRIVGEVVSERLIAVLKAIGAASC